MKRRNFLKRSVVAVGAVIVTGPSILRATKNKQLEKGIVCAPYIPIITASLPKLQPGQIGILYGLSGCGKSRVLQDMFLQKEDQYWNVESLKDRALSTILNHPSSGTLYIDGFNLIRLDNSGATPPMHYRNIIIRKLHEKAQREQCRIWITVQVNLYSSDVDINLKSLTSCHPFPTSLRQEASCIVYVRHENGYIYGDIIKNENGDRGTICLVKSKHGMS